jgi:hypothetical protein
MGTVISETHNFLSFGSISIYMKEKGSPELGYMGSRRRAQHLCNVELSQINGKL